MSSTTIPQAAVPLKQDATIIGLVGLAHASSHFSHLLLPLMFPVFMQEFALSYSELGLLMTTFFVVSGLGQASAGFAVDRLGARPLMFVSLGVFVVACVAASMVTGYAGLLLVAALAGLGNATFHPVDFTILNQRVSSPRLGYAFSAHGLTGNLGWAAAPVFFASITAAQGWRQAYVAAAVMYCAILVLLVLQRDKLGTHVVRHAPGSPKEHDMAFMRLPVVWWCFGFFLLSTMTLAVVQSFSVSILKAMHGISFEAATFTLTAYMLCGAFGMFIGGFVAAKVANSDRVVALAMACGAALLALCGTGLLGPTATMVVLASTGFAVGIGGPSRDMMIKKATPKGATGRVYGLVYSGLDVGFAISPIVFGVFMDRGWYGATLLGAALVLLLSVAAALGVGSRTAR
jgi:MFS transporter, FSR family, fosmidomycin resistance protein